MLTKVIDGFLITKTYSPVKRFIKSLQDRFSIGRIIMYQELIFNKLDIVQHAKFRVTISIKNPYRKSNQSVFPVKVVKRFQLHVVIRKSIILAELQAK